MAHEALQCRCLNQSHEHLFTIDAFDVPTGLRIHGSKVIARMEHRPQQQKEKDYSVDK